MPQENEDDEIIVTGARVQDSDDHSDYLWSFGGTAGLDDFLMNWQLMSQLAGGAPVDPDAPPSEPEPEPAPEDPPIVVNGTVDIDQIIVEGNRVTVIYTEGLSQFTVTWTYPNQEEALDIYEYLRPHTGTGENIPVDSDGNWVIPYTPPEPAFDESLASHTHRNSGWGDFALV
ncbi:MAG: hypothetical protein ACRCTD_11495 [Beijerinckiaceae bacterium]